MNEKQQVFNSLQNYYAISRLAYYKLAMPINEKEKKEQELFRIMQNIFIILFNNIPSLYLYKLSLQAYLLIAFLNGNADKELEDELRDAISPIDALNLRKNDPMEAVMKVVVMFAKRYSNYQIENKTDLVNNRYDTIYEELTKDNNFANIWMKLNIKEANEFSLIIKAFANNYKFNPLINVLSSAKNLIFNLALALLFKLDVKLLLETYNELVLPIKALMLEENDCKEVVHKLSVFADINYSKKHQMPISKFFTADVLKYTYNNPLFIDLFAKDNGFLLTETGNILTIKELETSFISNQGITYLDCFLLDILKKLVNIGINFNKIDILINDKKIILEELKKEGR